MKKVLVLIFLLAFCAEAQEASTDTSIVSVEYKSLLLTFVSWPFVHIIQPTVEFLIYPVIPPLIYISREGIIEKGANLITYGEKKQITFYPIMNASLGSSANIGFAYWHNELFFDNDNMFFSPHRYVNADWDALMRYKKNKILGTSFYSKLNFSYREYLDNSFRRNLEGKKILFADSSFYLSSYLGFNLFGDWDAEFGISCNFYRFDFSSLEEPIVNEYEYISNRGFYEHFESYPLTFSLLYSNLDEPYSATKGSKFSVSYSYVPVSSYNGANHNYHVAESRFVHYLLLGNKSYAMTVAESDANREKLKNLTFSDALKILNPINVREVILDRRVLITQLKARYMIEENKGKAPFIAMGNLGESFPLRAYADNFFTGAIVAGISNEYRWPLDRYADMLIFNEYGIYSDDYGHFSSFNLRNSYGFGFRVRTPNLFISRFALAFHGLQGISVVFTTKPEYN